jgi:ketosteroid isomerase-like protein
MKARRLYRAARGLWAGYGALERAARSIRKPRGAPDVLASMPVSCESLRTHSRGSFAGWLGAWLALLWVPAVVAAAQGEPPWAAAERDTRRLAELHIEQAISRDYDAMTELLSPDFVFIDPTADVYLDTPTAAAVEGIHGRAAALALMRSWELPRMEFERLHTFYSGQHGVFWGRIRFLDSADTAPFPVVFIVTVRDGRVVERRDYGDYVGLTRRLQAQSEITDAEHQLAETAQAYWKAYGERRFDLWSGLHTPDAIFQDETMSVFGPAASGVQAGSAAIVLWFDGALNAESSLSAALEPLDVLYSPHHAVMFASFFYRQAGAALGVDLPELSFEVPIVVALTIQDGKVTEHRDFWAAAAYRDQILAAQAAHPIPIPVPQPQG